MSAFFDYWSQSPSFYTVLSPHSLSVESLLSGTWDHNLIAAALDFLCLNVLYSNAITSVRQVEGFLSLFICLGGERRNWIFKSTSNEARLCHNFRIRLLLIVQRKHNPYDLGEEEEKEDPNLEIHSNPVLKERQHKWLYNNVKVFPQITSLITFMSLKACFTHDRCYDKDRINYSSL